MQMIVKRIVVLSRKAEILATGEILVTNSVLKKKEYACTQKDGR